MNLHYNILSRSRVSKSFWGPQQLGNVTRAHIEVCKWPLSTNHVNDVHVLSSAVNLYLVTNKERIYIINLYFLWKFQTCHYICFLVLFFVLNNLWVRAVTVICTNVKEEWISFITTWIYLNYTLIPTQPTHTAQFQHRRSSSLPGHRHLPIISSLPVPATLVV